MPWLKFTKNSFMISADIAKTVAAKRKRLEQYTQSSLKSSSRKVEDIWKIQQNER